MLKLRTIISQFHVLALVLAVFVFVTSAVRADNFDQRLDFALESAICERNGFSAEQVEIVAHASRIPEACRAAQSIRVRVPQYDDAIGPVTVRATFSTAGGEIASLPIPLSVTIYDDVLITKRQLKRHEEIRPGDLDVQRIDITRMAKFVVSDVDSAAGQWASRTINAGQTVDRRWLMPVPMVQRGDRVTVEYETGLVRVSTTALAMENGYRDQQITIKRSDSNRLLSAIVIDEQTVRPVSR